MFAKLAAFFENRANIRLNNKVNTTNFAHKFVCMNTSNCRAHTMYMYIPIPLSKRAQSHIEL